MKRFAVLIVLASLAPHLAAAQAPGGPPAVGVVQVKQQPITETQQFVGRIQATDRVALVARVTGFLDKQLFTEGAEVKPGDLLYQIEKPPFEADVLAKTAAIQQAEAILTNARITLTRAQRLLNTPAGQQSTVDDAMATQRSQAATLLGAQAQLQVSQINLGYTDIKAPIAGKISRTAVTIGNVVSPNSGTLATIVSQDPMYVYFPISVRTAFELQQRFAGRGGVNAVVVKLQLPDGKTYDQVGHIDYIEPSVAENTDTITLRATIANPLLPGMKLGEPGDRALIDGQFVTVEVQGITPVMALAIPQTAVLSDQQGNFVWVIGAGNKAEMRRVTLGQQVGTLATVTTGLREGETVVSDGVQRVHADQPVSPAPAQPGPGGAGGPPGGAASGNGK